MNIKAHSPMMGTPSLDKLGLRGFSGARDEFLLAATAQNLRRMAKWLSPRAGKGQMNPA
jgi:hypothetical protein